ncbi:hypothetical protein ABZ345_16165 [Lentzea sp. NPDC005914]|uniref:hypothetical protein n=1 Tax=Lentzea sp. NPDC005914 TaxID=3154572 RepID=UPI0033D606E8
MSDYLTLVYMNENVEGSAGAPLFFSAPTPAGAGAQVPATSGGRGPSDLELDPVALQAMSETDLQEQVLEMLTCLRRCTLQELVSGPTHTDSTLSIDSMTAVWIISTVGKALGRRLVRLSQVDRDSLRSVGGVAGLIKQCTASIAGAA